MRAPKHGGWLVDALATSAAGLLAALASAQPGQAIGVDIPDCPPIMLPLGVNGTDDAPIMLISMRQRGTRIFQPDMSKPAIGGGGSKNWIIDGFHCVGGKNGIAISANGYSYAADKKIRGIVIQNNLIEGQAEDGIKVNGGEDVIVRSNIVLAGGNDQCIDFLAIVRGRICGNMLHGGGYETAVTLKGGTSDIEVDHNIVPAGQGGEPDARYGFRLGDLTSVPMYPGNSAFEAARINLHHNVVTATDMPVDCRGAVDCKVVTNTLVSTSPYSAKKLLWVREAPATTSSLDGVTQIHGVIYSSGIITDLTGIDVLVAAGSALAA